MTRTKLAIIGVGLIGGSLGLCLKEALGDEIYITGLCRSEQSMRAAMDCGAVDYAGADLAKVVGDADIVYLSPPVLQIVPMVQRILPYLKRGAILTDAGSTKGELYRQLHEILPADIYYIPGHPPDLRRSISHSTTAVPRSSAMCRISQRQPSSPSSTAAGMISPPA